ncbi:MAG TPA: dephospho-CoA kinase, partial [Pyrinomonadaceae bacterium]|nr:dephospho-CoA kinase [Pyrinomonadaceae bacterium]
MLRVGLTGSIAVGKSFVSGVLKEFGCHVVDSDGLARKVVEPGTEGLRKVAEAFGAGVVRDDGSLDRSALGAVVFGSEEKRALLNSVLHPLIMAEQDALLNSWEQEDPRGVGVVDAALLVESGGFRRFDKLIV